MHIDHKKDDGHTDKLIFGTNKTAFLRHVLAFPWLFQPTCANCNHRKRLAGLREPKTSVARHNKKYGRKLRKAALAMLGGKCKCGEDDADVMCVDHVDGNGRQDRKSLGGSNQMYRDVVENPHNYQLLCHNCNWIKRHEREEWPKARKPL